MPKKPLVVLVPGLFGSHLRDAAGRVWIDDEALAAGGLRRLAFAAQSVKPDGVIAAIYRTLVDSSDDAVGLHALRREAEPAQAAGRKRLVVDPHAPGGVPQVGAEEIGHEDDERFHGRAVHGLRRSRRRWTAGSPSVTYPSASLRSVHVVVSWMSSTGRPAYAFSRRLASDTDATAHLSLNSCTARPDRLPEHQAAQRPAERSDLRFHGLSRR